MDNAKQLESRKDRGWLRIDVEECKGCGLCIEACPPKVLSMNERLNHYGYRTAVYASAGCTGCGICFMICPEPGAITVYRLASTRDAEMRGSHSHPETATEKDGANPLEAATQCASN